MRVIIYGLGAVGGTIAARLAASGTDVAAIARAPMAQAIAAQGLRLRTPDGDITARFPCHTTPATIDWRPDDIVLLTMKGQDTEAALIALQAAGLDGQTIACAQNGVENERLALRRFASVLGLTVIMPCQLDAPGCVTAHGSPVTGLFDLGRYPGGTDGAEPLGRALEQGGFGVRLLPDIMVSKRGKLLLNLGNIVDTALSDPAAQRAWSRRARAEAEAVLSAAGLPFEELGAGSARRGNLQLGTVEGVPRSGSSTRQSLERGAAALETECLNGEIVLLGRLHGIPTPVNTALCQVGRIMLAQRLPAGGFPEDRLTQMAGA